MITLIACAGCHVSTGLLPFLAGIALWCYVRLKRKKCKRPCCQTDLDPRTEEDRKRMIAEVERRGEFVTDVDGFVYYWPSKESQGHLSEYQLIWIFQELEERNKEWNAKIDEYFKDQEDND